INAASEFPDRADAIHRASAAQKRHVTALLGTLLEELFAADVSARLAEQVLILIDGATVNAQISGKPDSALLAREIARQLIAGAVSATSHSDSSAEEAGARHRLTASAAPENFRRASLPRA